MINRSSIIVLIPVYNDWINLYKTLNSINESINVDVLIVNDGSTKNISIDTIKENYQSGNIELINLEHNRGIETALNKGLEAIQTQNKYRYVARLDCGDISIKDRFKTQLDFLNKNEDVVLVGSQVQYIDMNGVNLYTSNLPITYESIRKNFYLNCQIIHPTVMFRSAILEIIGLYPTNYKAAEDYAFFFKIIKRFKVVNIDQNLVKVLINEHGISSLNRRKQVQSKLKIQLFHFHFGIYPILGIFRNTLLFFISKSMITKIRKMFG